MTTSTNANTAGPVRVDPVTSEIINNALVATAHEMNNVIVRTAFNPLLFDTKDFAIAVLSPDGELWAEDPGLTVFIGCLPATIKSGIAKIGRAHFRDGDVLIVNDPYLTGTHISDSTIYMPVVHEGELVAFVAVTAHWADIGGRTPGGWDMTSTELFQEGLCFTHQWLVREHEPVEDMLDFIAANVRFPDLVRGDLDAQISACRIGAARLVALCRRYGPETVRDSMTQVVESTKVAVAKHIAALPDGSYTQSVDMDYDGIDPDIRPRLSVTMTVRGDRVTATFDGTSGTAQSSMNVPAVGTRSAVLAAVKGLLAPLEMTNEGHFANIDFEFPADSLINPRRPAGCDSYGLVADAIGELTLMALSPLFPETGRAGSYQLFGVYLMRTNPAYGDPFIMIEPIVGGHGGHSAGDGSTVIFGLDGDTLNLPTEVMENRYPLRCLRYELALDSAGNGASRGGCGVLREYQILEEGTILTYANENTRSVLARGVDGGHDGQPSYLVLHPGTDREEVLKMRSNDAADLRPGDVLRTVSGGGGGWGV
ncbi:hydantoinase B/oxoprolinase family protein [Saccharopolyspora sp. ASAGF58]|uniref:hydantoinase B/oxoprolinase family protein n=1 Tax=Saccharopolyspora sp. ASAGF58 TaxID=2719023 RepID=UPI00144007F9|nr:hydantoinase B/oxoprolinase family protein [Saccharopolyspora sp. ASAGF58]QIZ37818.1 hydantoinase B/oxoprolinase family protein [Saccharopolyspora sp. ASAGF58]